MHWPQVDSYSASTLRIQCPLSCKFIFSILSTNQRTVYRSRDHPQSEASFKIIRQGFSLLSKVGNKRQFKCARIENVEIGSYDVKCNSKSSPQSALSGAMTFTLISSVNSGFDKDWAY